MITIDYHLIRQDGTTSHEILNHETIPRCGELIRLWHTTYVVHIVEHIFQGNHAIHNIVAHEVREEAVKASILAFQEHVETTNLKFRGPVHRTMAEKWFAIGYEAAQKGK